MTRRAPLAPASLTSLVDVLFILVFAALVQRAAAAPKPAAPTPPPAPNPRPWRPPPELAELRAAAEARLAQEMRARPAVVARVSARGVLTSVEVAPSVEAVAPSAPPPRIALELPLIERVPDPDIAVAYVAERDPTQRLCAVLAARLGPLARSLVIVVVDAPMAELMIALAAGLRRDVEACSFEHRAAASLLDSRALAGDDDASASPPLDRGTP